MEPNELTPTEIRDRTLPILREAWKRFDDLLPPQARVSWPVGAIYVRESSVRSLVGDAPVLQLNSTLDLLRTEQTYVPWENVAFENESGTEYASRPEFQRLIVRATAGEFKVIAGYLSHRFFRNAEEATAVKRQLRLKGVRMIWVGRPEMDERNPLSWQMERNTEIADEWHSRQTGWLVGRALEHKTLKGEPIGRLPEVWRITDRAPGLPGKLGRPIKWEIVEPLGELVRQAVKKYLGGASYLDLADWSLASQFKGVSPKGRIMDWGWWRNLLTNPKLAGYHRPTDYMGYKPGKQAPRRASARTMRDNLVACLLPPLITLEQHRAIVGLGKRRNVGPKRRARYMEEIICGVARDARCGHPVHILYHLEVDDLPDYYVRCSARTAERRHGTWFRAGAAGRELDALIGSMKFDDPNLVDRIASELEAAQTDLPTHRPSGPSRESAQLRAALASLDDEIFPELRAPIEAKLAALEESAKTLAAPIQAVIFRAAVSDLERWPEIWASRTGAEKSELLRAAGVTAYIEPTEHSGPHAKKRRNREPLSRLVRVEASVPEFALALALATENRWHSSGPRPTSGGMPIRRSVLISLPPAYRAMLDAA